MTENKYGDCVSEAKVFIPLGCNWKDIQINYTVSSNLSFTAPSFKFSLRFFLSIFNCVCEDGYARSYYLSILEIDANWKIRNRLLALEDSN